MSEVEAPPVPVVGPDWTLVSVDDAVFGPGAVTNVISIPDGYVAVGERCSEWRWQSSIWRSPDGAEWAPVFVGSAVEGGHQLPPDDLFVSTVMDVLGR